MTVIRSRTYYRLSLVAGVALCLAVAAPSVLAGTQVPFSHSSCSGYGHTHRTGSITYAETSGGQTGACNAKLQFDWWDPVFGGWVSEQELSGQQYLVDSVGIDTPGKSYHYLKHVSFGGQAELDTNTWQ